MRRSTGRSPAEAVENTLAARHLSEGTQVLYDMSSAATRGPPLPAGGDRAAPRRVKSRLQIVYGLLRTTAGIPIAIEVFEGDAADPNTLAAQISKLEPVRAVRVCSSRIRACSPTRASATRCAPRSSTG